MRIPTPDFVIGDTHFGHQGPMSWYPWRCLAINKAIKNGASRELAMTFAKYCLHNWEQYQGKTILHLGDVAIGEEEHLQVIARLIKQTASKIILIKGNHDKISDLKMLRLNDVYEDAEFELADGSICVARHNPSNFKKGESDIAHFLLHGHHHGNPVASKDISPGVSINKLIDCSMDNFKSIFPLPINHIPRLKSTSVE